jgi:glyoxylase-like metal-dependent hydrolase (beta-lactamase superfamily II)
MYRNCPLALTADIWLVGNYFFNLYLIRGARACALVEMGVTAVVDTVIGQLDRLGVSPDYLVLTHPHADHINGMPGFMKRYPQARLVAGEGAREFALHPKALPGMIYEDRHIAARLSQIGLPASRPPLTALPFPETHKVIKQTEDIDLGGLTLRCMPVQGHSPGNIVIHVPERATLLVSDSLGFHYPGRGFCPLFFTGFRAFEVTLAQLVSLRPEVVGPAHQGAIIAPDVETAFRQAHAAAAGVLATIRDGGGSDEVIAGQLFEKYYVDEFTLYSAENIMGCCRLLVRRAKEVLATL